MTTLSPPLALDAPVAPTLHAAADLIGVNGLHPAFHRRGVMFREYWPDAHAQPWRPSLHLSPIGAIGAALGLRRCDDVTWQLIPCVMAEDEPCHPAVVALWTSLGFDCVNQFLGWGDHAGAGQVVAALRQAAAATATCVSCGALWPGHLSTCAQIRPVRHAQAVAA